MRSLSWLSGVIAVAIIAMQTPAASGGDSAAGDAWEGTVVNPDENNRTYRFTVGALGKVWSSEGELKPYFIGSWTANADNTKITLTLDRVRPGGNKELKDAVDAIRGALDLGGDSPALDEQFNGKYECILVGKNPPTWRGKMTRTDGKATRITASLTQVAKSEDAQPAQKERAATSAPKTNDQPKVDPVLAERAFKRARAYDMGDGVERSVERAAEFYERAANLGHHEAMYQIGCMYATGEVVAKNPKTAVYWYVRSVKAGNIKAMHKLADHLADGVGVAEDDVLAVDLIKRAAAKGYQPSIDWLARIERMRERNQLADWQAERARERERASDEADAWRRRRLDNDGTPRK